MPIPKLLLIAAWFTVSACAAGRSAGAQGTGMIIAYSNTIPGKKVDVKNIVTDGWSSSGRSGRTPAKNTRLILLQDRYGTPGLTNLAAPCP
jgi:hypothetical protein